MKNLLNDYRKPNWYPTSNLGKAFNKEELLLEPVSEPPKPPKEKKW
jgi:hypothetical protein